MADSAGWRGAPDGQGGIAGGPRREASEPPTSVVTPEGVSQAGFAATETAAGGVEEDAGTAYPAAAQTRPAETGHAKTRRAGAGWAETSFAGDGPVETSFAGAGRAETSFAGDGHAETAGAGPGVASLAGASQGGAGAPGIRRYGPGVPGPAGGGQGAATAEEVWRAGLPSGARPGRARRFRRWAGTALSVGLIIVSGAVIWVRTHHPALGVTGVAVSGQAKSGCAVDVTGVISTNGGSGTVSYQWVFTPAVSAPQPLRQSVGAGQGSVYVTAAVTGSGHGTFAKQVTLQVLGPGRGSATARVVLSC